MENPLFFSTFSMNIPELPIQVLAVGENNSYGTYSNDLESLMISEGSNLADRLNAHFMTSTAAIQQKCKIKLKESGLPYDIEIDTLYLYVYFYGRSVGLADKALG